MSGLTEDETAQLRGLGQGQVVAAVEAILRDRAGRTAPAPAPGGDTDWWNDTAAAVERVRALADEWENVADDQLPHFGCFDMHRHLAGQLRRALAGTEETP